MPRPLRDPLPPRRRWNGRGVAARATRASIARGHQDPAAGFSSDSKSRLRFEREAKAISQLNHPNICSLYDVGHDSGTDYLVMELMEGESLADRIARGGALPLAEVIRYGAADRGRA